MKKAITQCVGGIVLVYLLLMAMMFAFQRNLMYFPRPATPSETIQRVLPEGQVITVETQDGLSLNAYFVPPKNPKRPIVIAFHGNGALAIDLAGNFSGLIEDGYGLLLAEYRGYGGNEGQPTEIGLYQDAEAYLQYLVTHFPDTRKIGYGQSLGSGVAVDLVSRHVDIFSGLILEVPFDSVVNVVGKIYPFIPFKEVIVRDQYLSDRKISSITIPKLFLIAGRDQVVGTDSGMNLYEKAPEPKHIAIFDKAGHMDVFYYGAAKEMKDFIKKEIEK